MTGSSRRSFLGQTAALFAAAVIPDRPVRSSSVDLLRPPDRLTAYAESGVLPLLSGVGNKFRAADVVVETESSTKVGRHGLAVIVSAPVSAVSRLHLRWKATISTGVRVLGDAWERGYGDLEWRGLVPDRILPWYFLVFDGGLTHGYGVETGAAAFSCWQIDAEGVSLWLDLRNGGSGVRLGERRLTAATILTRAGKSGESAFRAAQSFCQMLCPDPRLPARPVYGGNNWYYKYGSDCSAAEILQDSETIASLAPDGKNRPYMVIDDGWQPYNESGPWIRGNDRFPDMRDLAGRMKERGVQPGIWMRPLFTHEAVPEFWKIRRKDPDQRGSVLDSTVPEVRARIIDDISRMVAWGYDLIKYDYSSMDLLGRWGYAMGAQLTDDGWHFADSSRTNAEVALDLYAAVRTAAGNSIVIGCNTFGHLAAGLVELQRIGDDTSGQHWDRTRKMGVNSLAFRMPQQGAFFAADGDCVGLTPQIPWSLNSQWLDLLARSGTPLFVSADPAALGPQQRRAVRDAFERAARPQPAGEPLDWMETTIPSRWKFGAETRQYRWFGKDGPSPFPD